MSLRKSWMREVTYGNGCNMKLDCLNITDWHWKEAKPHSLKVKKKESQTSTYPTIRTRVLYCLLNPT